MTEKQLMQKWEKSPERKAAKEKAATMTKAEMIDEILTIMMELAGESPEFIQKMQAKWKAERGADA